MILLCVRGFGLSQAIADIVPAVGPETMIVPTLNGIMHLGVLASEFGRSKVLGGVCIVASRVDAAGAVEQLNDSASLAYGALGEGRISSRLSVVDALFKDAGFDTCMSNSIELDMWEKWIFMASAGALTCLLRGNVGEIEAVSYGRKIAHSIVDEAVSFASAAGFEPRPEFVESVRQTLTMPGSSFTSSTYRDLIDGNRVEVESILGDLVVRAEEHGLATPVLRLALVNLRIYARSREWSWLNEGLVSRFRDCSLVNRTIL